MKIPEQTIEDIRNAADIVDVVSTYVKLQKRGKNFVGLCPFHSEKTPSFTVSPEKGMYYCFGCSKGGNVITFIMEIERLSFVEAVKLLASRVGIQLHFKDSTSSPQNDERERIATLCQTAARWYHENLMKTQEGAYALTYCKQRGLRESTLQTFGIGYAPRSWDALLKYTTSMHFTHDELVQAGLARRRDDGSLYDYFRGRLMFPILSHTGKFIGFGARKLYDDDSIEGKYINSPETSLYNKSQVLYGLFHAKDAIRKEDVALLVEGYMDLLALFQVGIQNVVASSGTALTEQQLQLLSRYTKNLYLVFDADVAGSSATLRGIDLALERNFNVSVVTLPENEDPDSFIQKNGVQAFRDRVNHAQSWINFKAQQLFETSETLSPEQKASAIRTLIQTIAKVPDELRRALYIKDIAERYRIYESVLFRELETVLQPKRTERQANVRHSAVNQPSPSETPPQQPVKLSAEERDLLKVLLEGHRDVIEFVLLQIKPEYLQHPLTLELIELVKQSYTTHEGTLAHYLLETATNPTLRALISEILLTRYTLSDGWKEKTIELPHPLIIARDAVVALHRRYIQQKIDDTRNALKQAMLSGTSTTELLQQQQHLLQLKKKIESPHYLRIEL